MILVLLLQVGGGLRGAEVKIRISELGWVFLLLVKATFETFVCVLFY